MDATANSESKYLHFADELDRVRTKNKLNPRVWRALRMIAKAHLQETPIRTIDLMQMAEIGSPATIHKIIQYLIDQDMVAIQSDRHDGRVKYLIPTPRALKIFRELAARM
jgi:DNA-binding MarR family transcriptional regulator